MSIKLGPFEKALSQLRISLDYFNSSQAAKDATLKAQFRGACIQAFEFNYELASKLIRRQLAMIVPNPQTLSQSNFSDIIRMAADAGLVTDVKAFLDYRDARNKTSHTYDEEIANDVMCVIADFSSHAFELLEQLKNRNV